MLPLGVNAAAICVFLPVLPVPGVIDIACVHLHRVDLCNLVVLVPVGVGVGGYSPMGIPQLHGSCRVPHKMLLLLWADSRCYAPPYWLAHSCRERGHRKPEALQAAGGPRGTRCSRWSSSYDTSSEAPGRRRADAMWSVVFDLVACLRAPILFVLVRVTAVGPFAGAWPHLEQVRLVLLVVCDNMHALPQK